MGGKRKWVRFYLADWSKAAAGLTRIQKTMLFDLAVANWQHRRGIHAGDMELLFGDLFDWQRQFPKLIGHLVEGEDGWWVRVVRRMIARTCDLDRMAPPLWKETRLRIFERDGYVCTYCGAVDLPLECDHVHPVAKGGSHDDDNLTTACEPCNRSKRDLTVAEWRAL